MQTFFIAYRKLTGRCRVEFAVSADSREEAKQIAEAEAAKLTGYAYQGSN